jgi:hypothetical protein
MGIMEEKKYPYYNHELKESLLESKKTQMDLEFLQQFEQQNPSEFCTVGEVIRCMEIMIKAWKNKNA